jgi:hypothetical protein
MLKRLNNEFKKSKKLSYSEYDDKNKEVSFIYNDEIVVSMTIPNAYPFYPPKNLHVNYQPIVYFKLGNRRMIRKYFNIQCICCESIACAYNWKALKSLEDIVDEYMNYKTIINASILFYYMERSHQLPSEIIDIIARYVDTNRKKT